MKNAEGYADPTVHRAICNIRNEEKAAKKVAFRPLVYICSKYAGNVEVNTEKAKEYCRFALSKGVLPIAMHLMLPQFMDDNDREQRELAMRFNKIVQGKCNEVWVFSDGEISAGMKAEIEIARIWHQTIRRFNENCEEVSS